MVYGKNAPKPRKYQKKHKHTEHVHEHYESIKPDVQLSLPAEPEAQPEAQPEAPKKGFPFSGLINSFFGSKEKSERSSGKPIFNIMDHDIYLDDLLLVGLILLLMTDKMDDELLLIVLLYLLVDVF